MSEKAFREDREMEEPPVLAAREPGAVAVDADEGGAAARLSARQLTELSSGQPLPETAQAHVTATLGTALPGIRAHTGGAAADAAAAASAKAFTVGDDIFFGAGQFAPGSVEGDRLIAHEAAHVKQHREGRVVADGKRTAPADHPLELEADAMADGAGAGAPLGSLPQTGAAPAVDAPLLRDPQQQTQVKTSPWKRGQSGDLDADGIAHLKTQLMQRGVQEKMLGNLQFHAGWTDEQLEDALAMLDQVIHGGGPFGNLPDEKKKSFGRLVDAWNSKKDDLGPGNGPYRTLLHYVTTLEQIAQDTLGGSYHDKLPTLPTVRIAGVAVGVHPRNVYFAAAGQMVMDEKAEAAADADFKATGDKRAQDMKHAQGHGHYVPVAGFFRLLQDIQKNLQALAFSQRPSARFKGKARTDGLAHGKAVYDALRGELQRMIIALDAQEKGQDVAGFDDAIHREPEMRKFFRDHRGAIEAVATAKDDPDSARAAGDLLKALGAEVALPGIQIQHGWGSVDPHGTDHAIGNAVDLFYGKGTGSGRNMGTSTPFMPFIHALIEAHGKEVGLDPTLRPQSLDTIDPGAALKISTLLRTHGLQFRGVMRLAAKLDRGLMQDKDFAKNEKEDLKELSGLRAEIDKAFLRRGYAIKELDLSHIPDGVEPELKKIGEDMLLHRAGLATQSPELLAAMLESMLGRLGKVRGTVAPALAKEAAEDAKGRGAELAGPQKQHDDEVAASGKELKEHEAETTAGKKDIDKELATIDAQIQGADPDEKRALTRRRDELQARKRRLDANLGAERRENQNETRAADAKWNPKLASIKRRWDLHDRPRMAVTTKFETIAPATDPLVDVLKKLKADKDELSSAYTVDQALKLEGIVNSSALESWLKKFQDIDKPMFDQPKIMVDALEDVTPGDSKWDFSGDHHWTVVNRGTLLDTAKYKSELLKDMQRRSESQLQRILEIMAESDGGWDILFTRPDPELFGALDEATKGLKPATTSAALLAKVKQSVAAPGGKDDSAKLMRDMAKLGHHIK